MVIDESRLMTRSEEPGWISLLDATKMEERLCALRMAICGAGLLALLVLLAPVFYALIRLGKSSRPLV